MESRTRDEMICEAYDLLDPTEPRSNPEYLRGMCELIARCFPGPGCDTSETARAVQAEVLPSVPPYYVWAEGSCDDKYDDLQVAIVTAFDLAARGKDDVYVADLDNEIVYRPRG